MDSNTSFTNPSQIMFAMALLGSAMQGNVSDIVQVLSTRRDPDLRRFVYFKEMGEYATCEEHLNLDRVTDKLEWLKSFIRQRVSDAIEAQSEHAFQQRSQDRRHNERRSHHESAIEREALMDRLKTSNAPHAMGTVDQIAKQFNVSKSEVRRRKAAGTLAELLMTSVSASE